MSLIAQNPGNIGAANLSAWFKPDALPLGDVTTWSTTLSTLGTVTVTDATAPYPLATNTPAGNVSNYNTTLEFTSNTLANLKGLQNTASINLLQNSASGSQGTFFCAYYFPAGNTVTNNHMLLYNNSPHGIQFRNLGASGRFAIGLLSTNSTNASKDWTEDFVPTIISYKGNRSTTTSMQPFERDMPFSGGTASQSSGPTGLYMGFYPGNANSAYNGYLHEYIFYNADLSATDMRKVHSYLAIKYGVTLDATGGGVQGDYLSTNGTTIWDASVNPSYHHDVIGIGRDDNQALMQKQSHSFSDNYRVYLGSLAANNATNTGIFNNDISYITMGQTLDGSCGTSTSNTESPAGIASRIAKEWKVQNTNFNQTFNWDLKIDTCTFVGSTVGIVDLANIRLLVDTDGNFSNATSYAAGGGLSFTYSNGIVSILGISNIHLPVDSTRYFTVAYNTTTVNLSGNNSVCAGGSVTITVNIQNAVGPINVQYSNGTSTTTLSGITNGYTFSVTPSATTTYSVIGYKSFMDCCGSAGGNALTVTVNPYPTVVANASSASICNGQSTTLSGAGASSYVWNGGIINGSSQSPITTTTYTVIGQSAAGCADTASVTVTVNANPNVTASSSASPVCAGTQVTLTAAGALNYNWSNSVINGVAFTPSSTTNYIVLGTNASGCFDTAHVTVVVNPLPNVVALASDSTICLGFPTTLSGSGGLSYTWTGGITNNVPFTPTVSGTYTVTGTGANGCQKSDAIFIEVYGLPNVIASASPTIICAGQQSQLLASGANTYVWSSGTTNGDSISPVSSSNYFVVGADLNGCLDTALVSVTVNPNPIVTAIANPQSICEGAGTTLSGQGADTYSWSGGIIDNVPFVPSVSGNYTVIGTDANNCSSSASIFITVNPLLYFSIGPDSVTCPQNPITLYADPTFASYLWSNGETSSSLTTGTIGTVSITVTDYNGCLYTDQLVLFLADDCLPTYNIPNVFSPNGDNKNDFFFIDATNISEQTITIVNRWNNVMYYNTGSQPSWDGRTSSGAVADDGVYYVTYILKADNGETISGTSFFHLIGK
ncbi:MAG: gliding motility-associated C-terminal domain-containing protein [Crocinitomicaceae bacterium]